MSKYERKKIRYGEAFQRSVIKMMMTDHIFCMKAVKFLKSADFSPPLDWFFNRAAHLYEDLKVCPKKDDLTVEIARQGDSEQIPYMKELEAIMLAEVDKKTVISEMTGFIRLHLFAETAYGTVELVKREKHEEAYATLAENSQLLKQISFEKDRYVSFGDGKSVIDKMKAQKANAIPTGIKPIDDALEGGMFPGTWTTFLGATNAGKSMVNASLAYFAAGKGKRTFMTVHEDEELPTKLRLLSCFSKIPYNKLLFGFYDLSEEQKIRFEDADRMLEKYVKIQFMYASESSVETVCDTVRAIMKEWPFHLYICDYGGCLTTKRFKSMDNVRLVQEHVHHELKQLCLELDIPGCGGAQVNRDAVKKNSSGAEYLRMTDVAEAMGIVKKSSTVITMNRSSKDIENNLIVYLLDKSRGGVTNVAVECVSDYSCCSTHLPYSNTPRANQRVVDQTLGVASRATKEASPAPAADAPSKEAAHG